MSLACFSRPAPHNPEFVVFLFRYRFEEIIKSETWNPHASLLSFEKKPAIDMKLINEGQPNVALILFRIHVK